jgi:endonuclease/exonuclease/phosphatase family metal-dependent hydrolase
MYRILATLTLTALLAGCTASDQRDIAQRSVQLPVIDRESATALAPAKDSLKAITLNLAHGRKDSMNQWLVGEEKIRSNLDDIADFLRRSEADLVALQEADKASRWSGGFDHVAYLAEQAGYQYYAHAEHAQLWMGTYGTAVLSRWPITEAMGLTYPDSPPTASKGFTLVQIEWHNPALGPEPVTLDVISVHLDFSRKSVRLQQIDELMEVIDAREGPIVLMGDFNSEWLAEEYLVESTRETSRLHVYKPASEDLATYKALRLDWIMLSRRLDFTHYRVEPEPLSDHLAVVAEIQWQQAP